MKFFVPCSSKSGFWTCIVILLPMHLQYEDAASTNGGSERDLVALQQFKAEIVNDPQNVTRSWNDSTHFCNWEGIICGRRHRRVTQLDLSAKGLVGSLSPYIGNMSFLRVIRLQNNSLHGEIPQELGHLFRLQVLRLSNNTFEGKIPPTLPNCSNLISLDLGSNRLQGKIPVELNTLSKLKNLLIYSNYLSGRIPNFLGNLSLLERFSVPNNALTGSIPDSLGQLKYLRYIALGTNPLSGIIPPSIYNISSIIGFSVAENLLHGDLPSNIGLLLPHLQILEMTGNHFSGSIPVSLSNATKLEAIYLDHNNFTGTVDINFGGLQRLRRFQLNDNNLGGKDDNDLDFITSLLNCSNVDRLAISTNQFRGVLPNSVVNQSKSLDWLTIAYNQIRGQLPPWLCSLVSLSQISIYSNQITGSIPMEIGKLSRLGKLDLGNNRLSGPIPWSIGNLSSLIDLRLDGNTLQGTIPSTLGNCHNLLFLVLVGNNLSGSIPTQLFDSRSNLFGIFLAYNHLVGALPSEIGNLFHLNYLFLSHNNFSGKVPNELSRCNSLGILDISHNNFQGTMPPSLASLRGLVLFDLSMNNFSGKIPEYLEKIAFENLNMSYNNFEGVVPMKGVFANASAISVEGNKQLCGGIPELNLPRCIIQVSNSSTTRQHVKIIAIVVSCGCGMSMLLLCTYCRFRKKIKHTPGTLPMLSLRRLSYGTILKATNGFSEQNLIGVGSFGSVYKGILDADGTVVAIKVLNLQRRGASKSFKAECKALRNIRHRNLVKVITSCSSSDFQGNDFKALIYEFMSNGNLDRWLYTNLETDMDPTEHRRLNFLQRINIAIDVGNAINYLHHDCEKPVIHCDLKPSNILLDNEMVAHVGDFGLVKFLPPLTNSTESSSVGIKGTIGYTAPEYGLGSEVSRSGDVYSYGILILEILAAKKPTDNIFVEGLNLHNFARMALPDHVLEIVDPIVLQDDEATTSRNQGSLQARNECKIECLISMTKVGVACSMESPQDRMDITSAVNELISIKNTYIGATTGPSMHRRT